MSSQQTPTLGTDIAVRISAKFSREDKPEELKGKGSRERLERLLGEYRADDAKALKRFEEKFCMFVPTFVLNI